MSDFLINVNKAINKAYALLDNDIHNDIHKQHEFRLKTILNNNSLTKNEKEKAKEYLILIYDSDKVLFNKGKRRICYICHEKCLATLYCEYCIRSYLVKKFSDWTSENDEVDNLIKECQMRTLKSDMVIEWIPYHNFQNIEYLTEGGISKIYTANWTDGRYTDWDSENQQLKRFGSQGVILKRLENVDNSNRSWFEEARSHLNICSKWMNIVQCYGLTKDQSGDYMLVMEEMTTDLRNYLQRNHDQLTWKGRIQIIIHISNALYRIHNEKVIHRDLHSGNILYSQTWDYWYISDLGFCGPADKPLTNIYGNLPYIAPEVISGRPHTVASDIYSIGMLMWEISAGQPPFSLYSHDYYLAMSIIGGLRPKIVPETPSEYARLMKQCWDADPLRRPDVNTLFGKIKEMNKSYRYTSNGLLEVPNNKDSRLVTSKFHHFENLPEPRNATEEEQERIRNTMKQQIKRQNIYDDVYNNPNLHSKEQNELEIPIVIS